MSNSTEGSNTFPQSVKVKLELEIQCMDQDAKDYLVLPDGSVQTGFIADLFDVLNSTILAEGDLETINSKSLPEIQKILAAEL